MKKINELINVKQLGETTLSLVREIKFKPKETVGTYIFTNSIRDDFEKIFDSVISNRGGGFWIQAEYGAGKTHFIATLSCLLMDTGEALWNLVQNPEIRNYRFKLEKMKLFPVVINLKGEASAGEKEEKLLRIIERHIEETAQERNLRDRVSIATSDEIISWYKNCSQGQRDTIDTFIRQTGIDPKKAPRTQLAQLITKYCDRERITPNVSATTKDRIKSIYDQLEQNGYTGMLFVIDEFATRQQKHPETSKEYADDEEVLETLSWVLPKDLGLNTYIIVASHLSAPTKLKGDRFKEITLLAGKTLREYDIIAAQRVREIIETKRPEIEQYYQYYFKNFSFFKTLDREYFFSIFPFHPKCFEAIRNITKRELPSARAGINILHDVLVDEAIREKESLIPVSDLILGFHSKDLETTAFQKSNRSFRSAMDGIKDIELDDEYASIAHRVVKALFLWNLAYLDVSKYLSIQDMAEMELVHDDIIKGADLIEAVLVKLRDLRQVEYVKEKGARFRVTGEEAVRPTEEFAKIKRRCAEKEEKISGWWEKNLILTPEQTGGGRGALFSGYSFDQKNKINTEFQKIEYPGEIIVAKYWRAEYGEALGDDVHFRLVLLSRNMQLDTKVIKDRRIGVCVPDILSDSAKEAALNHFAITEMEMEYASKKEPEAEEIRQWIRTKKRECIDALLDSQLPLFAGGKVYTQQALAVDEKRAFASGSLDRISNHVATCLLSDAYQKQLIDSLYFRKNFSPNDAKKVFDGFFRKDAGPASISACENFGPGLGLSKSSLPKTFEPSHSKIFAFLKKKLEENNFDFPIWKLFRELGTPPYGLTKDIITLNLLCFVRFGDPSVEIRLRDGHRQTIGSSRLTSFNVPEIQWRGKFEEDFDLLSKSTEVSWNDILPLARLYAPEQDLKTATKPEDIAEQETRLLVSLKGISEKIPTISANLQALWSAFGKTSTYSECIKNIRETSNARGFVEFQGKLTDIYSGDWKAIENDTTTFRNLAKLSDQATTILGMRSYLDDAKVPSGKNGLTTRKEDILEGLDPESFIKDLTKFEGTNKQYEDFKKQYIPLYQIHHREYHANLRNAIERLRSVESKTELIQRLNEIGMNLATVKVAYSNLKYKIKPCAANDPVSVDSSPYCKECRISLTDTFDEKEVKAFLTDLNESVEQGLKGMSHMLTKPVLSLDKEKKLDIVVKSLESGDIDSFVACFSKPIAEYLATLFAKANIETVNLSVFEFIRQHSFVEEERIEEVTKAFRDELVKTMEKAKKEKPGKKIRIALGE
jgi:hypothetical protein